MRLYMISKTSDNPQNLSNNKFMEKIKKYKLFLWLGSIVLFLIIVLIVLLVINNKNDSTFNMDANSNTPSTSQEFDEDEGTLNNEYNDPENTANTEVDYEIIDESDDETYTIHDGSTPTIDFINSTFVVDFINNADASDIVLRQINNAIIESLGAGAGGSYTAFAAGKNVSKKVSFPYNLLSFVLEVSNGKDYNVQIALQNRTYLALAVSPLPVDNGGYTYFYIVFMRSAEDAGYDRNTVISNLTRWVQNHNEGYEILQPTIFNSY